MEDLETASLCGAWPNSALDHLCAQPERGMHFPRTQVPGLAQAMAFFEGHNLPHWESWISSLCLKRTGEDQIQDHNHEDTTASQIPGALRTFFFFWIQKKETVLNEWRDSSLALDSQLVTIAGERAESTWRHSDSWALDKHQDNDSPSCHVGFLHLLGLAWICGRVMDESSGCTY